MPAKVWLLNLIIIGVLLEADLGRRNIGWFRVLRPLIAAGAVVGAFLSTIPSGTHNVELMTVGAVVGIVLGLAAHLFISVGFDPKKKGKKGKHPNGRAVSWAGFGYAAYLVAVFGARLLFIYGSDHWYARSLNTWLTAHQLSANGLTDALIFMAIAMALARSALLALRGRTATRNAVTAGGEYPAGALGQNGTVH